MSKNNKNFAWLLRYRYGSSQIWNNVAIFSTPKKAKRFAERESESELTWDEYEHPGGWTFAYAARDDERRWQVRGYQFDA